jgi:lysophospholipase L1-like esterase
VFVVPPHRFCGHEAVTRTSSSDWEAYAISTNHVADSFYGVGGSTALTQDGRATIKLLNGKATHVELYYFGQPKGGTAVVTADGSELVRVDTKGDKQPGYAAATSPGASTFKITTEGHVRLFGIDLENTTGAVVDNLGIVSVNVKSLANNEPAHFAAELAHRQADLVMIMIGANEAEWLNPGDRDTRDYQAHYEKVLAPVRKGRPDAACLVVSPTDQAEEKDGEYRSRPVMPVLVEAQRKAARAQGCAFYSTYDWMGGRGSAARWFRAGLVGSDFQHLSRKGANKMADAVFDALMSGYKQHGGT